MSAASRADIDAQTFIPVSERAEGLTVLGRVYDLLSGGCPGFAGRGGCVREFSHEGDHMDDNAFVGYLRFSLVEVQASVRALMAERDSLKAKLLSGVLIPHDLFETIEEFFDQRADVRDSEDGPVPDAAMQLLNELREAR